MQVALPALELDPDLITHHPYRQSKSLPLKVCLFSVHFSSSYFDDIAFVSSTSSNNGQCHCFCSSHNLLTHISLHL